MPGIAVVAVLAAAASFFNPEPPARFVALGGDGGIYLEWEASPTPRVESYRIFRRRDGDSLYFPVIRVPEVQKSYFDTSAVGGVSYWYRIRSIDFFARAGPFSDSVSARFLDTLPPGPPDSLQTEGSERGLFLRWVGPEDRDVNGYEVFRGQAGDPLRAHLESSEPQILDSLAAIGVEYRYAVRTVDFSGNRSLFSDTVQAVLPDLVAPGKPRGFEAIDEPSGIRLAWQASEAADHAGYLLDRDTRPDQATPLAQLGPVTVYLDTTAAERVFYIYRLTPFDASGNLGEPAFAQAQRADRTAPSTPSVTVANAEGARVRLTWQPASAPDLERYLVVARSLATGVSDTTAIPPPLHVFEEAVEPGDARTYQVAAGDSTGNSSPFSEPVLGIARADWARVRLLGAGSTPGLRALPGTGTELPGSLAEDPLSGEPVGTSSPAEAFWYSGDGLRADSAAQVPLDGLFFRHPVTAGWNYVGNPFDITVDWLRVLEASGTAGSLLAYRDGIWQPVRRLVPGEGYAWYNGEGTSELLIPHLSGPVPGVRSSSSVVVLEAGHTTAEMHLDATPWADALAPLPPNPWQPEQLAVRPVGWSDWVSRIAVGAWPGFEVRLPVDAERLFVRGVPPGMVALVTPGSGLEWAVPEAGLAVPPGGGSMLLRLAPDVVGAPRPILLPPYPNPASSRLSVDFGLSVPGPISLELIDTLGRTVRTLERGTFGAGMHTVVHRPNLPGGTYLLRLRAEGVTLSRTVVIIR